MDIEIITNSLEESENIKYNLEMKSWTSRHIDVFVNFTEPLLISKGFKPDSFNVRIINNQLFRAADSDLYLMSNRSVL